MKEPSSKGPKLIIVAAGMAAAALGYIYLKRETSVSAASAQSSQSTLLHDGDVNEQSGLSAGEPLSSTRQPSEQGSEETRRFRASKNCAFSRRAKMRMEHELKLCKLPEQTRRDPEQNALVNFCKKRERDFRPALKRVHQALSRCDDPANAEDSFYASTLTAAQAGDVDAQLCYVRSNFDLRRPWSGDEHTLYSQLAPLFIQQSFERGDWRFVELLRSATPEVADQNSLLFQVTSGDDNYRYRMHRLLRLGAQGKYAEFLKHSEKVPEVYTQSQIQESNIWAEQMFERYFKRSAKVSDIPNTCNLNPVTYSPPNN